MTFEETMEKLFSRKIVNRLDLFRILWNHQQKTITQLQKELDEIKFYIPKVKEGKNTATSERDRLLKKNEILLKAVEYYNFEPAGGNDIGKTARQALAQIKKLKERE